MFIGEIWGDEATYFQVLEKCRRFEAENHFNPKICLSLAFGIFILSCIIIKCNIKFFDFLKKYFPTYYNLVRILFKRIS